MTELVISYDRPSRRLLVTKHCATAHQLLMLTVVHLEPGRRRATLEITYDKPHCECGTNHNIMRDQGCELGLRCICSVLRAHLDPDSCKTSDKRDVLTWLSDFDSFGVSMTREMVQEMVEWLAAFNVGKQHLSEADKCWSVDCDEAAYRDGANPPKTLH